MRILLTSCLLRAGKSLVYEGGVPIPVDRKYDSVNLVPFLSGEKTGAPPERLSRRTSTGLWAVREIIAKLVRQTGQSDERYERTTDISETNNLANAKSDATGQPGIALDAWNAEFVSPAHPGPSARKQSKTKAGQKQPVKS